MSRVLRDCEHAHDPFGAVRGTRLTNQYGKISRVSLNGSPGSYKAHIFGFENVVRVRGEGESVQVGRERSSLA